jgi:hypothetical protein
MSFARSPFPCRRLSRRNVLRSDGTHSGAGKTRFYCEVRWFSASFGTRYLNRCSLASYSPSLPRCAVQNGNSLLPSADFRDFLTLAYPTPLILRSRCSPELVEGRNGISKDRTNNSVDCFCPACVVRDEPSPFDKLRTSVSPHHERSIETLKLTVTFRSFLPFSPHRLGFLERSHHPPPRPPRSLHRTTPPTAHRAARSLCLG